jgi:CheY-like chemotaxis protein
MMPAMDGYTTLPLLRRFNPNLYAVAMSGLNNSQSPVQIERSGFQAFLAKPFTTADLLARLHSMNHSTSSHQN